MLLGLIYANGGVGIAKTDDEKRTVFQSAVPPFPVPAEIQNTGRE